jgi:hypothetical protein
MRAEPQKEWAGKARFDSINSTYKHKIFLDSKTKKEIIVITGYSKGLLGVESYDKTVMLEKQILRFVKEGYLFGVTKKYGDKTLCIEYYLNGNYYGNPDELILTLYPQEYVFGKNQTYIEDVRLNTFLKRLYSQSRNGEIVTKSLSHISEFKTIDKLFDVSQPRFKNEMALQEWCDVRRKEGHAPGLVYNYYLE